MFNLALRPYFALYLPIRLAFVLASICLICSTGIIQLQRASPALPVAPSMPAGQIHVPLQFAPNIGQASPEARMVAAGPAGTLAFDPAGVSLALRPEAGQAPAALRLRFDGAGTAAILGGERQASLVHYYLGADPAGWRANTPTYAGIVYRALYPGVDLTYEGRDGALKGTYLLDAGADPQQIRWRYEGASGVQVTDAGDLAIALPALTLTEAAPVAWQTIGGQRVPVAARYLVDSAGGISFALGAYDRAYPLTIDPTLSYGTFVGGAGTDWARAIAADSAGNVIITGYTYSTQFPGTSGTHNDTNVFVTKLNPAGSAVIYSTILGGAQGEEGLAVATDAHGNAWVTGQTESSNFPTKNPIGASFSGGNSDTFAAKLDPSGNVLAASYLGEDSTDQGNGIAVDPQGNAYIAGYAQAQFGKAAMVIKLSASGTSLIYKGFFGQAERGFDRGTSAQAIAVDPAGQAYLAGETNTIAFPVVNALQSECGDPDGAGDCDSSDAFVSVISADGTSLIYSSYLGGDASDEAQGIALDKALNIYVAGSTFSFNFPTVKAYQPAKAGPDNFQDAFVAKLTPQGDALLYSTYFGGDAWEDGNAVAVDATGNLYLAGLTSSDDLPILDAAQSAINGICFVGSSERYCYDAFVAKFDPSGKLAWSTYLGGTFDDSAAGVAVDPAGNAYVAGHAESSGFPTTAGSFQPNKRMQDDAFVVKFGSSAGGTKSPRAYLPLMKH